MNRANAASPPGLWLKGFAVDLSGALQLHEHLLKLHHVIVLIMRGSNQLHRRNCEYTSSDCVNRNLATAKTCRENVQKACM